LRAAPSRQRCRAPRGRQPAFFWTEIAFLFLREVGFLHFVLSFFFSGLVPLVLFETCTRPTLIPPSPPLGDFLPESRTSDAKGSPSRIHSVVRARFSVKVVTSSASFLLFLVGKGPSFFLSRFWERHYTKWGGTAVLPHSSSDRRRHPFFPVVLPPSTNWLPTEMPERAPGPRGLLSLLQGELFLFFFFLHWTLA